jgi:hypothetical protein
LNVKVTAFCGPSLGLFSEFSLTLDWAPPARPAARHRAVAQSSGTRRFVASRGASVSVR